MVWREILQRHCPEIPCVQLEVRLQVPPNNERATVGKKKLTGERAAAPVTFDHERAGNYGISVFRQRGIDHGLTSKGKLLFAIAALLEQPGSRKPLKEAAQ